MKPLLKSLTAFWCTYNVKGLIFAIISFYTKWDPKVLKKWNFFYKVALLFSQPKTFGASTHIDRQIQVLLDPGKWLSIFWIVFVNLLNVTISSILLPNYVCHPPMWHCWPRNTEFSFCPVAKCNQPEIESIAVSRFRHFEVEFNKKTLKSENPKTLKKKSYQPDTVCVRTPSYPQRSSTTWWYHPPPTPFNYNYHY